MVQTLLASGLTQKAIAARIGCSQPTISDIASGKVGKARPTYRMVSGLEAMLSDLSQPEQRIERQQAA
ncbi:helix-turn-helix domain-containing protein [Paraburkholderia atlantica]|uniref:helix-turn-helix domain-containing protein n=1 Tax=Paraburkholderia atlantica TaxID=2654982 RepID=UPI001C3756E2|nr:helix-turn-helix domain-containing protein [Paraburkholderia atlantica]